MGLFDVNYSTVWKQLTPPVLRKEKSNAWGTALLNPLQYLHDLVFTDYVQGSSYNTYNIVSAYTASTRVIYNNRRVYESLTGSTAGITPLNSSYWREINRNYIGTNERSRYSAQKLTYEYALNRWFQTSGIYIQNTPININSFLIGNTSLYSSTISSASTTSATTVNYISSGFTGLSTTCYTIYFPAVAYSGLSTSNTERESIVRSFADKINIAGMQYKVLTY